MSKRKETGEGQPENRNFKKQRIHDARTIAVQSNAEAGPSTIGNGGISSLTLLFQPSHTFQGVRRLGGAIDVEKFVEVQRFHACVNRPL
jgi:hypothetical protein